MLIWNINRRSSDGAVSFPITLLTYTNSLLPSAASAKVYALLGFIMHGIARKFAIAKVSYRKLNAHHHSV